jgi:hypothetical protein
MANACLMSKQLNENLLTLRIQFRNPIIKLLKTYSLTRIHSFLPLIKKYIKLNIHDN